MFNETPNNEKQQLAKSHIVTGHDSTIHSTLDQPLKSVTNPPSQGFKSAIHVSQYNNPIQSTTQTHNAADGEATCVYSTASRPSFTSISTAATCPCPLWRQRLHSASRDSIRVALLRTWLNSITFCSTLPPSHSHVIRHIFFFFYLHFFYVILLLDYFMSFISLFFYNVVLLTCTHCLLTSSPN